MCIFTYTEAGGALQRVPQDFLSTSGAAGKVINLLISSGSSAVTHKEGFLGLGSHDAPIWEF